MTRSLRWVWPALAAPLAACGVGGSSDGITGLSAAVFEGAVPRAVCGADDPQETALQGQVWIGDREAGTVPAGGYSCNIEIVGREGDAAGLTLAVHDRCAYYGIGDGRGVAVVDLADPRRPVRTTVLMTPAMANPLESLRANERRGLLAAVQGPSNPGFFDVYDVSDDCAAPVLKSIRPVNVVGHEGAWAPAGDIYYATTTYGIDAITAIDVTDPEAPQPITFSGTQNSHGLSISDDGNRAYLTDQKLPNQTGLTIVDTSRVQQRAVGASMPKLGSVTWDDGATGQHTIPVRIKGMPYVIYVDEGGYGAARLIDVSDETAPRVVSKLRLEIHMPENRPLAQADGARGFLAYDGHFCSVPRRDDPEILLCGYTWSGIRVFDIRDPYRPREIAYYNPVVGAGRNVTGAVSPPYFRPATNDIVFTIGGGEGAGLYVARLANGAWPLRP